MEFIAKDDDHSKRVKQYLASSLMPAIEEALEALLRKKAELKTVSAVIAMKRYNQEKQFSPILWLAEYLKTHGHTATPMNPPPDYRN